MFDVFGCIFLGIILVFVIIGIIKGFAAMVLGFAKWIIAIIIAASFCNMLGATIANSSMGIKLTNTIETKLVQVDSIFTETITNETKQEFIENSLSEKLKAIKLPNQIAKYVTNLITKKVTIPNGEEITCGNYVASGITLFCMICMSFVTLALVSFIILLIIQILLKNINLIPLVGPINRILGAVFGGIVALIIVSIMCYILSFMMYLPLGVADGIKNIVKYNDKDKFTIGKFFIENNILRWIFNLIFR